MIKVNNISKKYGNTEVLFDINLNIVEGEIIGLLGANGAGKSTLMKIICGVLKPNQGSVTIYDNEMTVEAVDAKSFVGYLPEHNPLYVEMYVREYLDYVAGFYNIDNKKERIEEVITLTSLNNMAHKKIGALSKGYRQRVGIAQAIIHNPKLLILDEPTTGLDPTQLLEVRKLIKSLAKGRCILFSTHIMQEVAAICDRVIIINNGKIKADIKGKLSIEEIEKVFF